MGEEMRNSMISEKQKAGLRGPAPFVQVGDGIPEGARRCLKSHGKERYSRPQRVQLWLEVVRLGSAQFLHCL